MLAAPELVGSRTHATAASRGIALVCARDKLRSDFKPEQVFVRALVSPLDRKAAVAATNVYHKWQSRVRVVCLPVQTAMHVLVMPSERVDMLPHAHARLHSGWKHERILSKQQI